MPGNFVLLAVSDDGCGMEKELMDEIFEPFFTTKGAEKGTGLGLSTVYGIVKQNGGFINVYSEPGEGTIFRIYLPHHDEIAPPRRDKDRQPLPAGRGERILLVEDDLSILELAQKILDGLGYSVLTAGTPTEALALAHRESGPIHLLVTDVIMPDMNGRELADRLRTSCPDLKCLFMSGYTADVIARHGVLNGGVVFLQKPFSIKELTQRVRKALDDTEPDTQEDLR